MDHGDQADLPAPHGAACALVSEQAARGHADALGPRVAATLRASQGGDLEVSALSIMPGGHSGLTYRLTAGAQDLVVKAVPPGQRSMGRHDMLRQARILQALADTDVPVPVRACGGRAGARMVRHGPGGG